MQGARRSRCRPEIVRLSPWAADVPSQHPAYLEAFFWTHSLNLVTKKGKNEQKLPQRSVATAREEGCGAPGLVHAAMHRTHNLIMYLSLTVSA